MCRNGKAGKSVLYIGWHLLEPIGLYFPLLAATECQQEKEETGFQLLQVTENKVYQFK